MCRVVSKQGMVRALTLILVIILLAGCGRSRSTGEQTPAMQVPLQPNNTSPSEAKDNSNVPEVSFTGKTIEVIINFSAGGPTDMFGRLVIRHLAKYLPGDPTVIVKNVPGAGGVLGTNTIYKAQPDGLSIAILSDPLTKQIIDPDEALYKSEEFTWLGGISETSVMFGKPELGLGEPKDLLNTKTQLVFGGLGQLENRDLTIRNMLEYLQVDYKYVTGYPGNAEIRQAFETGEINFAAESLSGYFSAIFPKVKDGEAVPFAQYGLVDDNFNVIRDERVNELPTIVEVIKDVKGEDALSGDEYDLAIMSAAVPTLLRAIVAPPGLDEVVANIWRDAMEKTLKDKDFHDEAEQMLGIKISYVNGTEAQNISQSIFEYINERPGALERQKRLGGLIK